LPLTEADKAQLADEKFDPKRAYPCCPLHNYYGPVGKNDQFQGARIVPIHVREHPYMGCKYCIKVFYICDIASVPPSQRAERFEELEEVLTKLYEKAERGQFDFRVNRHAELKWDDDEN
jgi:hypothetical protein